MKANRRMALTIVWICEGLRNVCVALVILSPAARAGSPRTLADFAELRCQQTKDPAKPSTWGWVLYHFTGRCRTSPNQRLHVLDQTSEISVRLLWQSSGDNRPPISTRCRLCVGSNMTRVDPHRFAVGFHEPIESRYEEFDALREQKQFRAFPHQACIVKAQQRGATVRHTSVQMSCKLFRKRRKRVGTGEPRNALSTRAHRE